MKLNKLQRNYYASLKQGFENGMDFIGWQQFKSTYRQMDAFYNKRLGVVLKRPRFIMESRTPRHLRVPTINLGDGWVLQPLVKKTRLKEAVRQIRTELNNYPKIKPDIHVGNVGWFDGKPLMFDW